MIALGYMPTAIKMGDYDETLKAVKAFQKQYKLLETDGQVGPQTKFAINTVLTAGKKGLDVKWHPGKAPNGPAIFSVTDNFLLGVTDAAIENAKGIWDFITHPIESAKDIAKGIVFLDKALDLGTEENKILVTVVDKAMKQAWNDFSEGNADKKARMIGRAVGEIVLAVVRTKGTTAAKDAIKASAESGKLGEMLGKVGRGASKADEVAVSLGKIGEALDVSTTSLDKLKVAFKGSSNPGAIVDEVVSKHWR